MHGGGNCAVHCAQLNEQMNLEWMESVKGTRACQNVTFTATAAMCDMSPAPCALILSLRRPARTTATHEQLMAQRSVCSCMDVVVGLSGGRECTMPLPTTL